jgi:hypothetical protein
MIQVNKGGGPTPQKVQLVGLPEHSDIVLGLVLGSVVGEDSL